MKKYLVWIGAAVLVMALASPSMAQFKTWGHLEVESYWVNNLSLYEDRADDNYQGIGMRYRFNLGYGDPKKVMAVLGFEANSRGFGEGPPDQAVGTFSGSGSPRGIPVAGNGTYFSLAGKGGVGGWGTDSVGLVVRHAYFDFTIPNTPLTMQIGMQPVVFGGFLGRFFFLKDVPGFRLNANFAPHTISAMWLKAIKQNYFMDNDQDFYGLLYNLKQKMFNVDAWFVYGLDNRDRIDTLAVVPTTVGTTTTYAITETLTPREFRQKPWWVGANVPITFGNWKIEPTFVYLGGENQSDVTTAGTAAGLADSDFSAYQADLMLSYRLGPGLKFLVEGYYATGRDGKENPAAGDTQNAYMSPGVNGTGTENRNVFGNGWSVFYFWNTELTYYNAKQLDPSGHAFARLNAEFNPLAWLNLNVNYLYILNTANKYNGHISGVAGPDNPTQMGTTAAGAPIFSQARTVGGSDVNKSYVGSEVNAIAKIAIYKDFQYAIGFGVFFPGDVYDTKGGTPTAPITDPQTGWSLLSNLRYVF